VVNSISNRQRAEGPRRFPLSAVVLDVLREHQKEQEKRRAVYGSGDQNLNLIFARPDGGYYSPGTASCSAMERPSPP
jgi:hypothetical protein